MDNWLITALILLGVFLLGALAMSLRKLIADELGHQYNQLPYKLFWLAAKTFPEDARELHFDEWADDYQAIEDKYRNRPLPRIYHGTRYSISLLARATIISRESLATQPSPARSEYHGRYRYYFALAVMVLNVSGLTLIQGSEMLRDTAMYRFFMVSGHVFLFIGLGPMIVVSVVQYRSANTSEASPPE